MTNILTTGIYDGHAFVIKNISKLAKIYSCIHCKSRFTQACHLQRHTERCSKGNTVIECPGEKGRAPETAFEKAFYPKETPSKESLRWLILESQRRRSHIHHSKCGHGGERWILNKPVDGFHPQTKTVFQYHGCYWHGCLRSYPDRNKIIDLNDKTREDNYQATVKRTAELRAAGYRVIEAWACEVQEIWEKM